MGKTQTALEYAYRHKQDYQQVFWVKAGTQELLISDFVVMASLLKLPVKDDKDQSLVVAAVKQWLRANEGWLLILDNANSLEIIENFLPRGLSGHVLITSRETAAGATLWGRELKEMTEEEGTLFLLRRAGLIEPDEQLEAASATERAEAQNIVTLLGGLPLALVQAGAYIQKTRCGLAGYLERYKLRRTDLLSERGGLTAEHDEPVAATWLLSFERVEASSPAAADLLRTCAFLHPDAIPEAFLQEQGASLSPHLAALANDLFALDDTLTELFKYSLIERKNATLSIHRLVQTVIQDNMQPAEQQEWAKRIVKAVSSAFPAADFENWPICAQYLPHVQMCAEWIKQWEMKFVEATRLLHKAGHFLHERGEYRKAEAMLEQARSMLYQGTGEGEQLTLALCLNDLAQVYQEQGKYKEGEHFCQQALNIQEKLLEPAHSDIAISKGTLARLYYRQGRYKEAERLYQQVLEIREQASGPEHPDTATNLNNLALVYHNQGRVSNALPLFQRALAISEHTLGPEHPQTALSLNGLALLYKEQARFSDALSLLQRALAISEHTLGSEHPQTATNLNNLADIYKYEGMYGLAETYFTRALVIREKVLGLNHPDTASSLANLATIYAEKGDFQQAEPYFTRALKILEAALGEKHPDFLTVLGNYAFMLGASGNKKKAKELRGRIAAIKEQQGHNKVGAYSGDQGAHSNDQGAAGTV